MTGTLVAAVPHVLIRRVGARPGSLHAAVHDGTVWRTACGEELTDGPRGVIVHWTGAEAHAMLDSGTPRCRRCDRVGDSVEQ